MSGYLGKQLGGERKAKEIYRYARLRSDITEAIFAEFNPISVSFNPAALTPLQPLLVEAFDLSPDVPNWETLFGSLDLCSCTHCRSMLSPAAYLVDIMAFLRGEELLESLLMRRKDIAQIKLNCENTNNTLPYIDLVNEILENRVANQTATNQTTLTSEILRAIPEHINLDAYTKLESAVYPWNLPFSLDHERAKLYLEKLGVNRSDLMKLFPNFHGQDGEFSGTEIYREGRNIAISRERLGIATKLQELITSTFEGTIPENQFWGISSGILPGNENAWIGFLKKLPLF